MPANQYEIGPLAFTGSTVIPSNNIAIAFSGSYNSTGSFELASNYVAPAVWSAGGAVINAKATQGGAGTQNAGLVFGGQFPTVTCTEEYNGTSWAAGGAMICCRYGLAGMGSQNAALAAAGRQSPTSGTDTEEYDGSTWATGGSLSCGRYYLAGAGTQNAGLVFGGKFPATSCTEEYNGTSWATGGGLSTARYLLGGAGEQNAAIAVGGAYPARTCTEEYDGSTWTAGGALNVSRYGLSAAGTQNCALAFGGYPGASPYLGIACTELYDGTTWSVASPLSCARMCFAGAGTAAAALAISGYNENEDLTSVTEEFTQPDVAVRQLLKLNNDNSLIVSASFSGSYSGNVINTPSYTGTVTLCYQKCIGGWSTGGTMITARAYLAAAGTQNAGLAAGGYNYIAPASFIYACTEEYDGTTWTAGGALINCRRGVTGAGTQNAGLATGATTFPVAATAGCTEEYDGTSWTAGGAGNILATYLLGGGTQNSAVFAGGVQGSPAHGNAWFIANAQEYDGSTWTAGGALITLGNCAGGAAGSQNAALMFGGTQANTTTNVSCTQEYDGTSWSAGGPLNSLRTVLNGLGTVNDGLAVGGRRCSSQAGNACDCTEAYDGFTWTTRGPLTTPRYQLGATGPTSAGVAFGGCTFPGATAVTEEYSLTAVPNSVLSIPASAATSASIAANVTADCITTVAFSSRILANAICADMSGSVNVTGSLNSIGCVGFCYLVPGSGSSTWTTGGAMNVGRVSFGTAGTLNAGVAFGGCLFPGFVACTEEYDGSSWANGGAMIVARARLAGLGLQNSALAAAGDNGPLLRCTEEYDGSSWTTGGILITCRYQLAGAGTQNSGLIFGGWTGVPGIFLRCTEEYDGSSWTTGGAMIVGSVNLAGAGTQNSGLAFGGCNTNCGSPGCLACTEEYNGTSWSAGGAMITARFGLMGAGTQNDGLANGGTTGFATQLCTEAYNGTSWASAAASAFARSQALGAGATGACAYVTGGGPIANTEEYQPSTLVVKSFDMSAATGITTVTCLVETSAQRYKDNVQALNSQLDKINQLKPVEFDWKNSRRHDIGFIAEDVAGVYPEIVNKNEAGEVEGISYSKMVAALVKAMQEQQEQIANLARQLNELKK